MVLLDGYAGFAADVLGYGVRHDLAGVWDDGPEVWAHIAIAKTAPTSGEKPSGVHRGQSKSAEERSLGL